MKIALVNNWSPFAYGGAELLVEELRKKLIDYGHKAIVVKIPFINSAWRNIPDYILSSRLNYYYDVDRVIAFKFPAYLVNHPNKIIWLLHQFRQAYDLWESPYQDVTSSYEVSAIRNLVINADNNFFKEAKKIYTNSKVVSGRLKKYNGFNSEVLYPPLIDSDKYNCREYGDYIFYPSRITRGKRQHLAIEAMKYTKSKVRLIIAGNSESNLYFNSLKKLVSDNNLSEKVKIIHRWISLKEKVNLFSSSLGTAYLPYYEDSYGYVTMESYQAKKPVVTLSDSGGTSILVKKNKTGYIVNPEPKLLAEKFDQLYNSKKKAIDLGTAGYYHMQSLKITWDNVIKKLTQKI